MASSYASGVLPNSSTGASLTQMGSQVKPRGSKYAPSSVPEGLEIIERIRRQLGSHKVVKSEENGELKSNIHEEQTKTTSSVESPCLMKSERQQPKQTNGESIPSLPQVIFSQVASEAGVIWLVAFLAAGCAHAVRHDPIALQAGRLTRVHHAWHLEFGLGHFGHVPFFLTNACRIFSF